ncbi:uncharacterized protein LOC6574367 [Drosophila mojavensis]|uniref:Uncharacterized protein n=1 Tax=Drosophila mojavensis TaxID=7230 RepID=B4KCN0_DROMO|nr:uncharacterized protein LOC6574367 [Drosophila mojavensis]EDW15879.1 uncharacterized protein Dmoj_GI10220 [Drosophila mojavensis]
MKAHSTAVDICQNDVDVLAQLQQLQSNHLLLRQQLTQLQRDAFRRRLLHQKRLYETRAALETQLRRLQLKHNRRWGL